MFLCSSTDHLTVLTTWQLIVYVQTKQWEEGIALSKEVYPKLLSDGDSTSCLQGISTKQRDQIVMYFARCLDASSSTRILLHQNI